MAEFEMVKVASSNVEAIGYNADTRTLVVRFAGGQEYDYVDVPAEVYNDLITARSVGSVFHGAVRGKFKFTKAAKGRRS